MKVLTLSKQIKLVLFCAMFTLAIFSSTLITHASEKLLSPSVYYLEGHDSGYIEHVTPAIGRNNNRYTPKRWCGGGRKGKTFNISGLRGDTYNGDSMEVHFSFPSPTYITKVDVYSYHNRNDFAVAPVDISLSVAEPNGQITSYNKRTLDPTEQTSYSINKTLRSGYIYIDLPPGDRFTSNSYVDPYLAYRVWGNASSDTYNGDSAAYWSYKAAQASKTSNNILDGSANGGKSLEATYDKAKKATDNTNYNNQPSSYWAYQSYKNATKASKPQIFKVIKNTNFERVIYGEISGSSNGVTANSGSGYTILSGKFTSGGVKSATIDGKLLLFQVIQPPTTSTASVNFGN